MMHQGRIGRHYSKEEKARIRVPDLLAAFDQVRRREQLDAEVAEGLARHYA